MTFGEAVRTARMRIGMSRNQLAEEVRLLPGFIEKIELGISKPPSYDSKVREIARVLMADEDEFMAMASDARQVYVWNGDVPLFDKCIHLREEDSVALW